MVSVWRIQTEMKFATRTKSQAVQLKAPVITMPQRQMMITTAAITQNSLGIVKVSVSMMLTQTEYAMRRKRVDAKMTLPAIGEYQKSARMLKSITIVQVNVLPMMMEMECATSWKHKDKV